VRKNSLEIFIFQSKLAALVDSARRRLRQRINRLKDQNTKIIELVVQENATTNIRQITVAQIADPKTAKIQQLAANLQLSFA
jgi:hypothetical protein